MKVYRLLVPGHDPVDFDNFDNATAAALVRARDGAIIRVKTLEKVTVTSFKLLSTTTLITHQEVGAS